MLLVPSKASAPGLCEFLDPEIKKIWEVGHEGARWLGVRATSFLISLPGSLEAACEAPRFPNLKQRSDMPAETVGASKLRLDGSHKGVEAQIL